MQLFDILNQHFIFFLVMSAIFGLLVGSFLNVVIHRLPKMMEQEWRAQSLEFLGQEPAEPETRMTLSTPNSSCPQCGHAIRPWENIPVISYLFLRGKCSNCKAGISLRYPLVELLTGALTLVVVHHFGASWQSLLAFAFTAMLIAMSMIDFDTQLLPDKLTLPLLWLGLIANSFGLFTSLQDAVWGAVAGYLVLWGVFHLFKILTGKEGMGYGDFKLLAALGAWMGWQALPMIILLSSLVGAIIGISLILFRGRDRQIPIPFGPYLAIAGWIALLWSDEITGAYLRFAGLS